MRRHTPKANFVCLTDVKLSNNTETFLLRHNWPGWWSKIELFRPGLFLDPVVYLDLDSTVTGDLMKLRRTPLTMISDFYRPENPASGVMAWTGASCPSTVYEVFKSNPSRYMGAYRTPARWGDQGFIRDHCTRKPERFGDEVASYKVHVQNDRVPDKAVVIAFHGKPKPWDLEDDEHSTSLAG